MIYEKIGIEAADTIYLISKGHLYQSTTNPCIIFHSVINMHARCYKTMV